MTNDSTSPPGRPGARWWAAGVGIVILIVALLVAVLRAGPDESTVEADPVDTSATSTIPPTAVVGDPTESGGDGAESTDGTADVVGPTLPGSTDASSDDEAVATSSSSSTTTTTTTASGSGEEPPETQAPVATEPEQPVLPTTPIPLDDEASTCRGVLDRLRAYRELALSEPMSSLLALQLGLDELENDIDFMSGGNDWGLLIVEQLVGVRREWSTAYSAHGSGEAADAEDHAAAAIGYLDAAIAVACPE